MPISLESDYFLCGMVECMDSTVDIYEGALVMRLDVDGLIDRIHQSEQDKARHADRNRGEEAEPRRKLPDSMDWYTSTTRIIETIEDRVVTWLDHDANPFERCMVALHAVTGSYTQLHEFCRSCAVEVTTNWAFHNRLPNMWEGTFDPGDDPGVPQAIQYLPILRLDADEEFLDRTIETYLRVYIEEDQQLRKFWRKMWAQIQRCKRAIAEVDMQEFSAYYERRVIAEEEEDAALRETLLQKISPKLDRKRRRAARKAFIKSRSFCEQVVGSENTTAFIAGDSVLYEGHHFNYVIKKTGNLVNASSSARHIQYDLQLISKEGETLASGCVFFENMPVLDQIAALSLMVREPDTEIGLLKAANWTSKTTESALLDRYRESHDIRCFNLESIENHDFMILSRGLNVSGRVQGVLDAHFERAVSAVQRVLARQMDPVLFKLMLRDPRAETRRMNHRRRFDVEHFLADLVN